MFPGLTPSEQRSDEVQIKECEGASEEEGLGEYWGKVGMESRSSHMFGHSLCICCIFMGDD